MKQALTRLLVLFTKRQLSSYSYSLRLPLAKSRTSFMAASTSKCAPPGNSTLLGNAACSAHTPPRCVCRSPSRELASWRPALVNVPHPVIPPCSATPPGPYVRLRPKAFFGRPIFSPTRVSYWLGSRSVDRTLVVALLKTITKLFALSISKCSYTTWTPH
jgi:hypothetical protein